MVQGYLETARNSKKDAKQHLKELRFSDSVRASRMCIELSVKSMYILLEVEFKRDHRLDEAEYKQLMEKIPQNLSYVNFPRVFLFANFWAEFYTKAKYGLETLQVPPTKLFEKQEAELALEHAKECYYAADQLGIKIVY
ncbi:MAG TPA: HEPN domain-containing protein [Desulfobacterales bacterium]|nr:HEPN domain-containing protein [Desulfobacterales bacterium]